MVSFFARFFLVIFLPGLLLGWGTVQVAAQSDSFSEAAYWQLVAESRAFLGDLIQGEQQDNPGAQSLAQLESLAVRWENVHLVRLDNGAVVRLDGSSWARLLRANPPNLTRLHELFLTLERERQFETAQGLSVAGLTSLYEILERPEYQWREETPGWLETLWQRFIDWLFEFINELGSVNIPAGGIDFSIDIINILAFVLIAAILVYAIKSMFSDFISESALEFNGQHEEPLSARLALNRANTLSSAGDYREATRYLYLSALLILDERGLLFYDRTKTNREYLRQVVGNERVESLLRDVIGVFDRVWYGFQPVDEDSYRRYAEQVRELENLP